MPSSRPIPLIATHMYESSASTPPYFLQLLQLPTELVCHTLSFLNMYDLIACKMACKSLHQLVSSSPRLQYTIDLAEHQMVPALSPSSMSIAAQRRMLNNRQERWKTLRWKGRHSIPISVAGPIYELVDGIYASGHGRVDDRRVAGSITFHRLPTVNSDNGDEANVSSWTLSGFDMDIIDFSMDPAQDLLVLIAPSPNGSKYTYQVHLRTLSTNEPHPKAGSPVLDCRRASGSQPGDMWCSFRILILDNLLAVLIKDVFHTSAAFVAIWNWQARSKAKCQMALTMGVDDFCFLSRTEFMVVIPRGFFDVYKFTDPAVKKGFPIFLRRFGLPLLKEGFHYWYISATANPTPGIHFGKASSSPSASNPLPFYPRPDDGLIACSLGTLNPSAHGAVGCFVFFMRIRTLLDSALVSRMTALVPWESWGPPATRWFGDMLSSDWQHAVHGFRTVERVLDDRVVNNGFLDLEPAATTEIVEVSAEEEVEELQDEGWMGGNRSEMRKIRVKDFNPYAIAREATCRVAQDAEGGDDTKAEDGKSQPRIRLVTGPAIVRAGVTFQQDVVSRLPYREIVTEEPMEVSDVMLDDNRILCLRRNPNGQLHSLDVLTF